MNCSFLPQFCPLQLHLSFQFAFKLSVVQVAYMVRRSCRISNPDFITHAYMVLTGLKRMRFVDQIQYADAISLSSWLCYFFGGLVELGKCRITYNEDVFFLSLKHFEVSSLWQMQEEDDIINSWNLRKCSAAGLDILSTVFGDEILPILMPLVQVNFCFGCMQQQEYFLPCVQNHRVLASRSIWYIWSNSF
jgi:hypothetical protein